jgi:hypothetical protein
MPMSYKPRGQKLCGGSSHTSGVYWKYTTGQLRAKHLQVPVTLEKTELVAGQFEVSVSASA